MTFLVFVVPIFLQILSSDSFSMFSKKEKEKVFCIVIPKNIMPKIHELRLMLELSTNGTPTTAKE